MEMATKKNHARSRSKPRGGARKVAKKRSEEFQAEEKEKQNDSLGKRASLKNLWNQEGKGFFMDSGGARPVPGSW